MLPLFETIPTEKPAQRKRRAAIQKDARTVEEALNKMRGIREEINALLYNTQTRPTVQSPADSAALIQDEMEILDHEELFIMLLDRRNKALKIIKLYSGSVSSSQVRIGELFKDAIINNASALIMAHNHPSGDPTPSPDDVALTRAAVQAGKLLDIDVLDHIIIGFKKWVSLKERGLGFN